MQTGTLSLLAMSGPGRTSVNIHATHNCCHRSQLQCCTSSTLVNPTSQVALYMARRFAWPPAPASTTLPTHHHSGPPLDTSHNTRHRVHPRAHITPPHLHRSPTSSHALIASLHGVAHIQTTSHAATPPVATRHTHHNRVSTQQSIRPRRPRTHPHIHPQAPLLPAPRRSSVRDTTRQPHLLSYTTACTACMCGSQCPCSAAGERGAVSCACRRPRAEPCRITAAARRRGGAASDAGSLN